MNKKIHELMMQATSVTFKYNPMSGELDGRKEQFDKEKFAELIVQECANFVREEYDHEHAESIAWTMEVRFGLHGDYA